MTHTFTTTKPDQSRKSEFCVNLGLREFCVTVNTYPEDGSYNAGQTWVSIEEWIQVSPTYGHWRSLGFSEQIHDSSNDLDCLRYAFRSHWSRLKREVRNRAELMEAARGEQGGKRGYYTRLANENLKRIPALAEQWKLCKTLWKEITKL